MIYSKTDVCHVTSAVMTYDLKFTLQHTTAANVGVTNAIASFYRDSDTVFHGVSSLYVPILYLSTFSLSNAGDFHLVMTGISGNVPALSKISDDFIITSKHGRRIFSLITILF